VIEGLPQIFWEDGSPWREANLWAMERVTNGEAILKTVSSNLNGLLNYAKFLESRMLQWFEFPSRKADRCLVQYRGALTRGVVGVRSIEGYAQTADCSIGDY